MFPRYVLKPSEGTHGATGVARSGHLYFEEALNDCVALSELAMDMVEAHSSFEELIWIQNGFKPPRRTRRAKPRRQGRRS
jgi:hypothetical protein